MLSDELLFPLCTPVDDSHVFVDPFADPAQPTSYLRAAAAHVIDHLSAPQMSEGKMVGVLVVQDTHGQATSFVSGNQTRLLAKRRSNGSF